MPHKHWIPSITAAACILAGMLLTGCKTQQAPPQAGPAEVAILTVKAERVVLTTELPGRINSYLVAEIRPQVSGLLQKRLFEEGTHVREGQILYQIDPAPYQATYDQAKAALALSQSEIALAEANLPALRSRAERLKGLVAIHAVGQQDYDDAKAALDQAEANLSVRKTAVEVNRANMQKASIDLSYTPIKAPISGRIGKSNITVGAMVTAYQATPLAVIQQLDPIYVDVTQASADLLRLRRSLEGGELKQSGSGQRKVRLLLEDGTSYPATGTLQFRDVTVDPTTGSMTLRLVFPNPKQVLLPGMFVRAVVEEGVNEQAVLIPQQAVARDPKGNPIALLVNSAEKVEQRPLTLDRAIEDKWLVTKGLTPGDQLIVEGNQSVRAGDTVKTIAFEPPAPQHPSSAKSR
ncbi:MAG: efflux RND transporter periplasmic adaptor subunit [Acidobacteriota bacterium]|nr:efflux RND transporter periplasmic adaptor subunit [Acidobacteriota bacterium]